MATASSHRYAEQLIALEKSHPIWASRFGLDQREEMVEQDLFAGRSVSIVLVAVVTLGFSAIVATVLACL